MHTESHSTSDQRAIVMCLRGLLVVGLVFLVGASTFAFLALQKLDRVVAVVDNVNAKIERAFAAAAPLGTTAVEKGVQALEKVDTDDLGRSATDGVKEIGRAAKQRAIEALKQRRAADETSN